MFLKGIEIKGFKSFADKTNIVFKNGVTGVVGPNGSGKSNISDAIRWVLGEQSIKTLRGGKMEDVIFAGTQFRKNLGLAEVSLILDNKDKKIQIEYEEIVITRRLYRSGESEYRINGTKCRLKDVQELFMDTGIGKEGYSIIGQGKIETVLSGKQEERRGLFEEAAGIVKYRARKDEAERKLNNTENNLIRIYDILNTYEERLEPLRIENEKAATFLKLSNELKSKEITILLSIIEENENELEKIKKEEILLVNGIEELENIKNKEEEILKKSKNELENIEENTRLKRKLAYEIKDECSNNNSKIEILKGKISNIDSNIERILKEIDESYLAIEKLKNDKEFIKKEIQKIEEENNIIEENIREIEKIILEEENKLKEFKDLKSESRSNEIQWMKKVSEIKNRLSSFNEKIILSNQNIIKDKRNIQLVDQNIKNNETGIEEYENNISTLRVQHNIKKSTLDKIHIERSAIKVEYNIIKEKLIDNDRILHRLTANLDMLKKLEKNYEGYNRTSKQLMTHILENKLGNISEDINLFGDIIQVKDGYETAIEISLGAGISDIITRDDILAKKLIEYLKANHLGRATFLPLNILRSNPLRIDKNIKEIDGYIGVSSELIDFDDKFKSAVENKLGRILIARDMNSALFIAKKLNYSVRVVTLDGEVVNPGGSLVGGSTAKRSAGILERKREIETLEEKLIEINKNIDIGTSKRDENINKTRDIDEKSLILTKDIQEIEIEITKKISEKQNIIDNIEKFKIDIENINTSIYNEKNNISTYESEIILINQEKDKLEKEETKIGEDSLLMESKIESLDKKILDLRNELSKLKVDNAKLVNSSESKKKDLERIENDIEYSLKKIENNKTENNNIMFQKTENETEIDKIKELLKVMEIRLKEQEESFLSDDIEIIRLKKIINNKEEKHRDLLNEILKEESKKNKIEVLIAKVESEYNNSINKINDEMDLTIAQAKDYRIYDISKEDLKLSVDKLKKKINEIGLVNIGAIEEYKDVLEKYTFMNVQRDDLVKAKEELMGVIDEMLIKMREVFNENFKILKENFKETFRQLFKGGNGDLVLGEGDELSADIDINVEPPGKRLQNINLMSGGEKGLSAIALLFAILKMKPSPFCVLDEIEAALDDVNVFRYAEFLSNFSCNSQFIVITHRKGTMERCDALYGVTMEEKGVSKIVSVDLKEAKKTIK